MIDWDLLKKEYLIGIDVRNLLSWNDNNSS